MLRLILLLLAIHVPCSSHSLRNRGLKSNAMQSSAEMGSRAASVSKTIEPPEVPVPNPHSASVSESSPIALDDLYTDGSDTNHSTVTSVVQVLEAVQEGTLSVNSSETKSAFKQLEQAVEKQKEEEEEAREVAAKQAAEQEALDEAEEARKKLEKEKEEAEKEEALKKQEVEELKKKREQAEKRRKEEEKKKEEAEALKQAKQEAKREEAATRKKEDAKEADEEEAEEEKGEEGGQGDGDGEDASSSGNHTKYHEGHSKEKKSTKKLSKEASVDADFVSAEVAGARAAAAAAAVVIAAAVAETRGVANIDWVKTHPSAMKSSLGNSTNSTEEQAEETEAALLGFAPMLGSPTTSPTVLVRSSSVIGHAESGQEAAGRDSKSIIGVVVGVLALGLVGFVAIIVIDNKSEDLGAASGPMPCDSPQLNRSRAGSATPSPFHYIAERYRRHMSGGSPFKSPSQTPGGPFFLRTPLAWRMGSPHPTPTADSGSSTSTSASASDAVADAAARAYIRSGAGAGAGTSAGAGAGADKTASNLDTVLEKEQEKDEKEPVTSPPTENPVSGGYEADNSETDLDATDSGKSRLDVTAASSV